MPLNPYLRGTLAHFLREKLRAKDLRVVPEHLFSQPGMRDFQEWALIRRWMMKWLEAVRWYSMTAIKPVVSIEEIIANAPLIQSHWNLVRKDESLFRFGLLWACFDKVGVLETSYVLGILPEGSGKPLYLNGGFNGTSYLA